MISTNSMHTFQK